MAGDRVTDFAPLWDEGMARFAKRWVAANHHRVRQVCPEREDSLQECLVVYAKCARLYAGKIDNQAWFMAVYKTALARYWTDLERHSKRLARGDAAACQVAEAAPVGEAAVAPMVVLLTEARQRVPQLDGPLPAVLGWLLGELPTGMLPQCGRLAQQRLARELWQEAA